MSEMREELVDASLPPPSPSGPAGADGASDPHPFLHREGAKIRGMFDDIAPRYDLLNHLLSLQLDRLWRRWAVRRIDAVPGGTYLDACCGTGDLAFTLGHRLRGVPGATVVGSDFAVEMLRIGERKRLERKGDMRHAFVAGDTTRLPFADATFSGITVGFGIRNVEALDRGLAELARVLRPGARLVLLEFTRNRTPVFGPLMNAYCRHILPWIGNRLSGSRDDAYGYLQQSIDRWPECAELAEHLERAGLREVAYRRLPPGNVALHWGRR